MVVVGAGLVGLSTAWYLRARGADVTVLERRQVGAGSSWGNAGWLSPAFAVPLPEPATLRAGLSGLLSRSAPLSVPAAPGPRLLRFLLSLARHCTERQWRSGLAALTPLNLRALDAHEELAADAGLRSEPMDPCLVATLTERGRDAIVAELEKVRAAGQSVEFDLLDGDQAREREPFLSPAATGALRLRHQRFIDPGRYLRGLAEALRARGVRIDEGSHVRSVRDTGGVELDTTAGPVRASAVVLATGAALNQLARPFGVRRLVQAGRGYSVSVTPRRLPRGPVYFPEARVVFTPLGEQLRVSGAMEFRSAEAPVDRRRIAHLVAAARPLVRDVDWSTVADEWVGARPCTVDGLPLVGGTLSPSVFVAGGHGMWGITHGPITGRLLAETVLTGAAPPELAALHPLR